MSEAKWENLPVLDWELAKKLASQQIDLAKDLLAMLTRSLPEELNTMNQLAAQENYSELLVRIHKLHGAVAYCGTPRLKALLAHIEMRLKNNSRDDLSDLMAQLNTEINDLLAATD